MSKASAAVRQRGKTMPNDTGRTFVVELKALPDSVPAQVRLRTWLKSALRAARFRALRVSETTPQLLPLASVTVAKGQAADKKLAGAALTSFMKKCQTDATASCNTAAADKKLVGAAKSSFTKKCVTDAVGI